MRSPFAKRLPFVALALGLLVPAVTPAARAESTKAESTKETEPAVDAPKSDKSVESATPTKAASDGVPIFVEKLPGSAFPRGPYAGIEGGSLWLNTFHGLQWPYMNHTGIGVSGSAWIDTGYEGITRPNDGSHKNSTFLLQQGRAVLRVTPTYVDGDFFIQGQVELVGNKEQKVAQPQVADTDDIWVRFGRWNKWDVQVGRYESWELYHLGMALDLNTLERIGAEDNRYSGLPAVDPYLVRFGDTRPAGVGNAALHLYPNDFLRLELLGLLGNEGSGLNSIGTRPSAILDFGMIKIKVGGELTKSRGSENIPQEMNQQLQMASRQTKFHRGFGGSVQLVLPPWIEGGLNFAKGITDETAETSGAAEGKNSYDIVSFGGFANARLMKDVVLGTGVEMTNKQDTDMQSSTNRVGKFSHLQIFGAVQYAVASQLYIKLVFAQSKAHFAPSSSVVEFDNVMTSARVRLMYLF